MVFALFQHLHKTQRILRKIDMKHIGRLLTIVLTMILIVGVTILGLAWQILQWKECRQAGLSRFYCVQHISN